MMEYGMGVEFACRSTGDGGEILKESYPKIYRSST